jgi:hypothetical protein
MPERSIPLSLSFYMVTKRYVDEKNSDELSIGYIAFNEAIDLTGLPLTDAIAKLIIKSEEIGFIKHDINNVVLISDTDTGDSFAKAFA